MVVAETTPGISDGSIYTDGFHDKLARHWPEPREQLHAGGWAKTAAMISDIKRLAKASKGAINHVLDLCCGEGATAAHVAAKEGWKVTGVDVVESAVKAARSAADKQGTVVRVKLHSGAENDASCPVRVKLSYDTIVRVKLLAGESSVRLSLSYDTVVRVTLVPAAAPLSPVHLNLSYDTAVRVKLVTMPDGALNPRVQLKLSYGPGVSAKLTEVPADHSVKLSLSYPDRLYAKLIAEPFPDGVAVINRTLPPVHMDVSYGTDVHVKLVADERPAPLVRLALSYEKVADLVEIVHASILDMPLPSNTFDVVYGQDPDGLANEHRVKAFKEVFRVLRPGGLFYFWHHWIPGPGWPAELLAEYWSDPATGATRLSHDCYLEDIKAAGLEVAEVSDCTELARHHFSGTAALMRAEAGLRGGEELPDKWLERTLQFAERGGSMGIQVVAYKPE